MVFVIEGSEGNEDVAVKEDGHSSSSRSRLTSSDVMTRPSFTVGKPVSSSQPNSGPVSLSPSPRRMSHATASLSVQDRSRAIAFACRCKSSGRSMVVLMVQLYIATHAHHDAKLPTMLPSRPFCLPNHRGTEL